MKNEFTSIICPVTADMYRQTAECLCDAVGSAGYFSGSLCFSAGTTDCRLTASVIVYREERQAPDGISHPICDLVPVWWEFHTVTAEGEVLNDFSFGEMKQYI